MTMMKGVLQPSDSRLGRIPQYDERSRGYPIRPLLTAEERRPLEPWYPAHPTMNQGPDGACVGFSLATALNSSPIRYEPELGYNEAFDLYHLAQHIDAWDGCEYGADCPIDPGPSASGSSVLAGLKVVKEMGLISSYRWCFSIDDVVDALHQHGIIFGTPIYNSMFSTRGGGYWHVDPDSGLAGYHAYHGLAFRYEKVPGLGNKKRDHVVIQNSWGPWGGDWYGVPGHAYVLVEDLEQHLLPREVYGEAAVVIEGV